MDVTRTTVAHMTTVANGMPLAAISAREEVPPCCVTVISAYACRQFARSCDTVSNADGAVVGLRRRHLYGCNRRSVLIATTCRWRDLAMAVAASSRATKLRARERFFPNNFRRGLLSQACNKPSRRPDRDPTPPADTARVA